MFREVHDDGLPPPEEEVSGGRAQHHGGAQPPVVRHEHQHQHVAHQHLRAMKHGLPAVGLAQHCGTANKFT